MINKTGDKSMTPVLGNTFLIILSKGSVNLYKKSIIIETNLLS